MRMLRVLGLPTVDGAIALTTRMAYVAAAVLDLAPGRRMTRAGLAEFLWPSTDPGSSSNNLRQLLAEVRGWQSKAGVTLFEVDHRTIGRSELSLPSDVGLLFQLRSTATEDSLERLLELCRGELLEGFEGLEGEGGIWLMASRQRVKDKFVRLAVPGALAVRSQSAGEVLELAARIAPYDEEIVRAQMVVATATSSARQPDKVYGDFAVRLRTELGSPPEAATSQLLSELGANALDGARRQSGLVRTSIPKVLILPPSRPGGDTPSSVEDARLVDALIDEVTHTLGSIRTFAVIAPHSARLVASATFPQANPYGANYLITTTLVGHVKDAVRLRFAVVNLEDHRLVLSEEMECGPHHLRISHDGLVAGLVASIAQRIEQHELGSFQAGGTASAYVSYLLGNQELRGVDLPSVRRARKHLQRALKEAPEFARARAMLARTYSVEYLLLGRTDHGPLDAAVQNAQTAIEIDPGDPMPRRELGHALIYLGRLDDAVDHLASAADRGPHIADVLCTFGDSLVHVGRNAEAREMMDHALALNPLAPDLYHWISATSHFMLGDYESAKASIGKMSFPRSAGRIMAASEALLGNLEAAHRHRDRFMAENPDFSLENYAFPVRNPNRAHLLGGMRAAGFH